MNDDQPYLTDSYQNQNGYNLSDDRTMRNHQIYQENRRDLIMSRLIKFFALFFLSIDLAYFIAGIIVLKMDWNKNCDEPLNITIIYILSITSLNRLFILYKLKKNIIDYTHHPKAKYIDIILQTINLIIWILSICVYANLDSCSAHNEKSYLLAYIIGSTIILLLPLLPCFLMCLCLPCLICIVRRIPINNNGLKDGELDQMIIYEYGSNGTIKPIIDEEDFIMEEIVINDEHDKACCICLENYTDGIKLRVFPCKHHMHQECGDEWLKLNNSCPICREPILHRV